jgi:hypothetical protein
LVAAAVLVSAVPARAEVHLTIHDGLVTLNARDATVRDILAEWEQVGHAKVVNRERIPGGPMTLEFSNLTELQALEILLRPMSGYLVAPRTTTDGSGSRFDRIVVMPVPTAARPVPGPLSTQPPQQPRFVPPPMDDQAEDPNRNPGAAPPAPRPPIFQTIPAQQNPAAPAGTAPPPPTPAFTTRPTAPPGVAVPGMVVQQPPAQPGQPAAVPPQQP